MSDTIYDDLKQQGLILSEQTEITLPSIKPKQTSFLGKISALVSPEKKVQENKTHPCTIIIPILNSTILVGRANTLISYKY
jgi:hypothetical protein